MLRLDSYNPFTPNRSMDKETLSNLIDAYADAKVSRNKILVEIMIVQIREALDLVFNETSEEAFSIDTPSF